MTDDDNGWNDAPEAEGETADAYTPQEFGRAATAGQKRTVTMQYEGLPPAANVQQTIILAQLHILRDLERRTRDANTQLSIDPIGRIAA